MKKYLNANELVINFKINFMVKKRNVLKSIGATTSYLDREIKRLENSLRRD